MTLEQKIKNIVFDKDDPMFQGREYTDLERAYYDVKYIMSVLKVDEMKELESDKVISLVGYKLRHKENINLGYLF